MAKSVRENHPPEFVGIGAMIWTHGLNGRSEWTAHFIREETKGLWISGHHKINKKTMMEANGRGRGDPLRWYSQAEKTDAEFMERHAHRIAGYLSGCSAQQLREIANIVGYNWNRV